MVVEVEVEVVVRECINLCSGGCEVWGGGECLTYSNSSGYWIYFNATLAIPLGTADK